MVPVCSIALFGANKSERTGRVSKDQTGSIRLTKILLTWRRIFGNRYCRKAMHSLAERQCTQLPKDFNGYNLSRTRFIVAVGSSQYGSIHGKLVKEWIWVCRSVLSIWIYVLHVIFILTLMLQ